MTQVGSENAESASALAADRFAGLPFLAPLVLACAALVTLVAAFPRRMHWDPAIFVTVGERIVAGDVPFRDVFELNPPLMLYLHALAALLAHGLGLPSATVFLAAVVAACFLSLGATRATLAGVAPASAGLVLWVCAALALVHWRFNFGQREQLFALAYVPYLILRWRRREALPRYPGPILCGLVGFATGLLGCAKPHFLVSALVVELWLWRGRWRAGVRPAPELAGGAAAITAYAALLAGMPNDARAAFWGWLLPLVTQSYGAYDGSLRLLVDQALPTAGVILLALILRPRGQGRSDTWIRLGDAFVVFGLASLASYAFQHKGWPYHLLPAGMAAVLASAVYLSARQQTETVRRALPLAALFATALVIAWDGASRGAFDAPRGLARLVDCYAAAPRGVAFVTGDARPHAWLGSLGYSNARTFTVDFPLRMLAPSSPEAEHALYWRSLRQDLARQRTTLVLIDDTGACSVCAPGEALSGTLLRRGVLPDDLRPLGPMCALTVGAERYSVWARDTAPGGARCR